MQHTTNEGRRTTLSRRAFVHSTLAATAVFLPHRVASRQDSIVVDGQPLRRLGEGQRVHIERATSQFQLLEVAGHSYYRTLREKLGWGGHIRSNPPTN